MKKTFSIMKTELTQWLPLGGRKEMCMAGAHRTAPKDLVPWLLNEVPLILLTHINVTLAGMEYFRRITLKRVTA